MWCYTVHTNGGARTAVDKMRAVARYYDISSKADRGDIFIVHDQKSSYHTHLCSMYIWASDAPKDKRTHIQIAEFTHIQIAEFTHIQIAGFTHIVYTHSDRWVYTHSECFHCYLVCLVILNGAV